MPFTLFRRHDPHAAAARALYLTLVEQARSPAYYRDLEVADTVEGRFDMVALFAFLIMHRLKGQGEAAAALSQSLFDLMFADMDSNLRELGVSDIRVGKRVKRLAEKFYGRIAAYEAGLSGEAELTDALDRNLYDRLQPTPRTLAVMAGHLRAQTAALEDQSLEALMRGVVGFRPPPGDEEER